MFIFIYLHIARRMLDGSPCYRPFLSRLDFNARDAFSTAHEREGPFTNAWEAGEALASAPFEPIRCKQKCINKNVTIYGDTWCRFSFFGGGGRGEGKQLWNGIGGLSHVLKI